MKLYTIFIPENIQPGRLLAYVKRMLPDVPDYVLREAFQKRDVKVNGQRVGLDALLAPGAEVKIYARETEAKRIDIPILYEDENVLVVIKPAGISCDTDAKGGVTLPELLYAQMKQKDSSTAVPLLCHRLDNPTEGLILLAKTQKVQLALQDAFRNRQIHKEYMCIVRETPSPAHQVLTHWLYKDASHSRVRIIPEERRGAKKVITEYHVVEKGECARLRILLHTGRTHQIRAHMAFIGHPLLGDDQYGDRAFNRAHQCRKLMLCATRLTFELEGELSYLNEKSFTCKPTF